MADPVEVITIRGIEISVERLVARGCHDYMPRHMWSGSLTSIPVPKSSARDRLLAVGTKVMLPTPTTPKRRGAADHRST